MSDDIMIMNDTLGTGHVIFYGVIPVISWRARGKP
jgi:hypothetical protein